MKRKQEKKDLLHAEWVKQLDSLKEKHKKSLTFSSCPCGCFDAPAATAKIKKELDTFKKCPCGCIG